MPELGPSRRGATAGGVQNVIVVQRPALASPFRVVALVTADISARIHESADHFMAEPSVQIAADEDGGQACDHQADPAPLHFEKGVDGAHA